MLTCSHLTQMAGWPSSWFMIYLEGRPAWTTVYWTSTLWRVTYVVGKSGDFFSSPTLAPSTGNLQWTQWRIFVLIVSILVNRWTPVQSMLLGLYCWIWHTWLYWTVPSSDWWLLRHQMCKVSFPRNVFSGNILML